MATTKKTATQKTATKKATAKRTATVKTAAPKTAPTVTAQLTEGFEDVVGSVVKMTRDTAHAYVGFPLAVQDRIVSRSFADATFAKVMTESRERGEEQVAQFQAAVEPVVSRITARIEPVTDRIESSLPAQVREAMETSRERVRKLVAN